MRCCGDSRLKDELVESMSYLFCVHLLTNCSIHTKKMEHLTSTDTENLQSFPLLKIAVSCVKSMSPLFPVKKIDGNHITQNTNSEYKISSGYQCSLKIWHLEQQL